MTTSSFDKSFVVSDEESINQFFRNSLAPRTIIIKQRNYQLDKEKGISLLKRRLLKI